MKTKKLGLKMMNVLDFMQALFMLLSACFYLYYGIKFRNAKDDIDKIYVENNLNSKYIIESLNSLEDVLVRNHHETDQSLLAIRNTLELNKPHIPIKNNWENIKKAFKIPEKVDLLNERD